MMLRPLALLGILIVWSVANAFAQGSAGEHASHHPGQAIASADGSGSKNPGGNPNGGASPQGSGGMMGGGMGGSKGGMGGGKGGMMGGGKGGGMGGMMEKMGAPKPKDLYPSLMELPDLPLERRAELEQEAHARMIAGARVLGEGVDELSRSAASDDFAAMQAATEKIREGVSNFDSGLATHRALREGKAPRNVALQWFKREMNLGDASRATSNALLWGMSPFHTSLMVVLVAFTAAMIWMYFFKMRRAASLLQQLATASPANPPSAGTPGPASISAATSPPPGPTSTVPSDGVSPPSANESTTADCCDDGGAPCPTEAAPNPSGTVSDGVLAVAKRKLCRLRVARIVQETDDVKTFRLVACHGGGIPFSYLPGQFLTLTLPVAEKPIRRSYTISSSPTQGYYCEVTVKREDNGAGSRYLHDQLKVGDTLQVKAPSGKFVFTGQESNDIVLISGGVGITPMMSIARALTDMCWPGDIYFIAACRDPEHFIFETEIKRLQQEHANLHLFAAMSRLDSDTDGYRAGRLNKQMLQEWVPDIGSKRIHICGAPAMMDSTKAMLAELDVPAKNVHSENFGSAQKPKPKAKVASKPNDAPEQPIQKSTGATVTFATSGKSAALEPDETLLEASERVGVDIEYSCRTGTCGECITKLLSGEVSMEVDDALEPGEKEAGMILACQAIAKEDVVVES